MKTSNEIKTFVVEHLQAMDPMALFFEFFKDLKEGNDLLHVKAVISRWRCACREASKENNWGGLSESFPLSIFSYNATLNAIRSDNQEKAYRALKDGLGIDVKAIAEGKHCTIAQIIIDTLNENIIRQEKERLGLGKAEE